jgi:hypothetical protein
MSPCNDSHYLSVDEARDSSLERSFLFVNGGDEALRCANA